MKIIFIKLILFKNIKNKYKKEKNENNLELN